MAKEFEYTTWANRYTARFPVLTYVGTQANFWIIVNLLLVAIMHLQTRIMHQAYNLPATGKLSPMLLLAVASGVLYGVSLGLIGYYLDRRFLKKMSLGKIILFKALGSLALLTLLLWLLRFVFFNFFVLPSPYLTSIILNSASWNYLFYLLLIYYSFMTLVISFINQVNKKYGPGVLVPLLLGRYRYPREEKRIFMFMDLKSSTTIAENLGHLKYSSFIRDCFADINEVLFPFRAQVYQYVGDEIVVTWPETEGLSNQYCIRFYFACKKQFQDRAGFYLTNYGLLPEFKAGVHSGKVTAVEIGEIKKDIAYHGDTLNTAARIQSLCNEYQKSFLVSESLLNKLGLDQGIKTEALGMILLRGKTEKVGILSVGWIEEK
ncbi:adenylate/guanylate cyclase domain-containing protein [Adhaeribacter radiodurans]|uniref:Adenylate/guanylate cyclase domain-containing protein n=1 Tax=Adhaeribacter radiodurans TaxID=2745197 RepID=A0A7L7L8L1_9BACT|nr:adenylate/guanylate cyclase domain-containing protein [Adhaeribacter radiodurans]QMU29172.1 adenylate/guanylate cyclase domain-containing protein [Adhaeribacter radiodurans]